MLIDSNVPRGGGLSSSAALEVAVCTALAAGASTVTVWDSAGTMMPVSYTHLDVYKRQGSYTTRVISAA